MNLVEAARHVRRADWRLRDDAHLVARALDAAVGIPVALPVVVGGKVIAWAKGESYTSPRVFWTPAPKGDDELLASWTGYADIQTSFANGQRSTYVWTKTISWGFFGWFDLWAVAGNPSPGSISSTSVTAEQFSNASAGAIPYGAYTSGTRHLTKFSLQCTSGTGIIVPYDRVLDYGACPITAATQTMGNTLTAQRYAGSGLPGLQIFVCLRTSTAAGATASNLTSLVYVNQAGTGSQSMPTGWTPYWGTGVNTIGEAFLVGVTSTGNDSPALGPFLPLATGDTGVRSITSYQSSADNTSGGDASVVLMHPLGYYPIEATNIEQTYDNVNAILNLPLVLSGACIGLLSNHNASAGAVRGGAEFGWS